MFLTSKIIQKPVDPPGGDITHVYTRQHDTKGLEPSFRGPFKILSRPTRSTLEIKVGLTRSGEIRSERRAWADCKPAHRRSDTIEAERPRRGRPRKDAEDTTTATAVDSSPNQPDLPQKENSPRSVRSTRNQTPNYVAAMDFSKPPPGFVAGSLNSPSTHAEPTGPPPKPAFPPPARGFHERQSWSASAAEIAEINATIARSPVRCEARG